MQTILFTNFSNEVFTHSWDKEDFTFQPGQSIYLQDFLAKHFAKHLANRELLKTGVDKYIAACGNEANPLFQEFFNRALSGAVETSSPLQAEIEAINLNEAKPDEKRFCDQCDSKGVRHKKDCPTLKSEEEFAGLKGE